MTRALRYSFVLLLALLCGALFFVPPETMANVERVKIPPAFRDFLQPARYKIAYGGRGSAKSESVARLLLLKGLESQRRVLCARELQTSIRDSVHQTLLDIAEQYNMPYRENRGELVGPNGTRFLYRGLRHNVTEIKSLKGITDCWVEEAQVVSEDSWKLLTPTIREPGSEIYVTFNPDQEKDPTFQRCVVNPQPGSIVRKVNWDQNPYFPEVLRAEKDWLYQIDPEAADWVWGGNVRKLSNAIIFAGRFTVEPFTPQASWGAPLQGVDWGFSTDPSVLVQCYFDVSNRTVYVYDESWGLNVEMEELGPLFSRVQGSERYKTRADSARPETISYVKREGGYSRMLGCQKWPGCVEDGIQWLKGHRIVVHPRCVHTREEAALYAYKVDSRTNEVLPEIVDKHNHCWDAIRYALEPHIRTRANVYAGSRPEVAA